VPHQRILRGVPATLQATFMDQHGEPKTPAGPVTVTVIRWDGTAVVTDATTTIGTAGKVTAPLTAVQTGTLDLLTAAWTDAASGTVQSTVVEVVGGFYFTLAEARRMPGLEDGGKVPDDRVFDVRRQVEEEIEDYCGFAWVPRFSVLTLSGRGTRRLALPVAAVRTVRSVALYGTAVSSPVLAKIQAGDEGVLDWTTGTLFPIGDRNIVVAVEHGLDGPTQSLKEAALVRTAERVQSRTSGLPRQSISENADGVQINLATPGMGNWLTAIPDVDAVIRRYRSPTIA
jgi:hypothetical protein